MGECSTSEPRDCIGGLGGVSAARPIDGFMDKVEELADRSKGKIRADVALRKLVAMGFPGVGTDRPGGRSRGMWLQFNTR